MLLNYSKHNGTVHVLEHPVELQSELHEKLLMLAKLRDRASDELEKKEYADMEDICSNVINSYLKIKQDIPLSKFSECTRNIIQYVIDSSLASTLLLRSIAHREMRDYDSSKQDLQFVRKLNPIIENDSNGWHRLYLKLLNAEALLSESHDERIRIYSRCISIVQCELRGELTAIFDEYSLLYNIPPSAEILLDVFTTCLKEANLAKQFNANIVRPAEDLSLSFILRRFAFFILVLFILFLLFYMWIGDEEY